MVSGRYPENLDNFLKPCAAEDVLVCFVDLVALLVHGRVDKLIVVVLLHVRITPCVLKMLVLICEGQLIGSFLVNVLLN